MARPQSLVIASTNLLRQKAVRDVITRLYPTTATVTATLYQSDGTTPITGAVAISMPYVSGTSGHSTEYRGTLSAAAAALLTEGSTYILKVTVTDTVGDVHVFQKTCIAVAG